MGGRGNHMEAKRGHREKISTYRENRKKYNLRKGIEREKCVFFIKMKTPAFSLCYNCKVIHTSQSPPKAIFSS